jgi:hypothetical protein
VIGDAPFHDRRRGKHPLSRKEALRYYQKRRPQSALHAEKPRSVFIPGGSPHRTAIAPPSKVETLLSPCIKICFRQPPYSNSDRDRCRRRAEDISRCSFGPWRERNRRTTEKRDRNRGMAMTMEKMPFICALGICYCASRSACRITCAPPKESDPRLLRRLGAPGPAQTHESISCHRTTYRGIASRPYRYRPAGIACIGVRVNLGLIDNLGLHRVCV